MKKRLLFRAPCLTASGYGVHSRQLLKALIDSDEFDLYVDPIRWGETPFLTESDPLIDAIRSLSLKKSDVYDISVQVTIPNEFQKLAPVNIGVTAGIETDRVSPSWIVKTNENIDLLIVPSRHSAETFSTVRYKLQDNSILQLTKPIVIVPEGVDTSVFNIEKDDSFSLELPSSFNFICVGLGLDKNMGEDRKNISQLVKYFCEKFKDEEDVGLVLKVGIVNGSLMDHNMVTNRIRSIKDSSGAKKFPLIHLVHGRLSDREMASLYKHPQIKAFVSLTHGEGFGLPLLEAAACGLPVMTTGWSGHMDFLKIDGKKKFVEFEHDLTEIPKSSIWPGVMEEGSRWANIKEEDVKHKLKKIVSSYDKPKEWAQELAAHISKDFSTDKTGKYFVSLLKKFLLESAIIPRDGKDFIKELKSRIGDEDKKRLLYTMPMSAGDVYISTAVVDSLKKKYPEHLIYFATSEQYVSILKDNPDIHRVIRFDNWMMNVPLCEQVFDLVFTPNLSIQLNTSNWVRGGKGRLLAEEMAAQCNVELGEYKISLEEFPGLPDEFIAFNPGPMKGQWESRSYLRWQSVINNVQKMTGLPVVQVGQSDDPSFDGVNDLRGKTDNFNKLAYVVSKASVMFGIDTATMHISAGLGVPVVSIFGSSYPTSTGPANAKSLAILMETPNRYSCDKACYKNQCSVNKDHSCVNEIKPQDIVMSILELIQPDNHYVEHLKLIDEKYEEYRPKISGYTTVLNAETMGFPYIESIKSMLGFCDEVVVVDGGSTDSTKDKIKEINDPRINLIDRAWDKEEPGMDGMQKAFARAMANVGPGDFLWQQDADEVVHEEDYQKIKDLVTQFPRDVDVIHLPVVELWGDKEHFRSDRHSWKWRLSRNNFRVTHGINKDARVLDEKTGRTYAKRGMSDGCEMIDIMTQEHLPHKGFYSKDIERLRINDLGGYEKKMNEIFKELPSVFHYSWCHIPRKVRNFRDFWDKQWSILYGDPENPRFPGVTTDEDVVAASGKLRSQGGEHGPARVLRLERSNPALMTSWPTM